MFNFKKHILIFVGLLCLVPALAQKKQSVSVYFDTNKYLLKNNDYKYLNAITDSLSKFNIHSIEVIGHTDNAADSLYNIRLSNKRANEVRKHFLSLGFNENIVTIGYFGENKPVAKNDNEADKRKNRRAEIIFTYGNKELPLKTDSCMLKDTTIRTRGGKEIVFNGCEYNDIKNCLEIIDQGFSNELKKGIVVIGKSNQDMINYGMLKVNLLDGCVKNECFKHPVIIRFPVKTLPVGSLPWVLVKGEKTELKLVEIKGRNYYEFRLNCPTSWINCNCKKNQKH